jgi:hypothetical protein
MQPFAYNFYKNLKGEKIMKKWKNFLLVVVGIFAITTISAYQDECCKTCTPCECPPPPPCCDVPSGPTTSAYNHPANINVCGCWDAFVTGTFLWILPSMEQMEFAETAYGTPPSGTPGVGKIHEFNFEWKPAFKVGLGFNFDHDNWDVYLQYLRVHSDMSNSHTRGTNAGEILSNDYLNQVISINDFPEVKGKWDLDFNTFDLEFGRPYYNGKCLQFRAHYGLKGGWIDNIFKSQAISGSTIYEGTFDSKSWLVGPRAGIQTKWTFSDGFRFFGDAAASLFYQKFYKISVREPYVANPTQWFLARDLIAKQINASLESILGIGYGTYFDRNNWYFDLAIGYEVQLFLNQNKLAVIRDMLANTSSIHVKAGNLMFHGLNVTMKFDF